MREVDKLTTHVRHEQTGTWGWEQAGRPGQVVGRRQGSSHGPQGPQSPGSGKTGQQVAAEVQLMRVGLHQLRRDHSKMLSPELSQMYSAQHKNQAKNTHLDFFLVSKDHPGHVYMHSTPFSWFLSSTMTREKHSRLLGASCVNNLKSLCTQSQMFCAPEYQGWWRLLTSARIEFG